MDKKKKEVFGTKEWAKHSHNAYSGCQHDCKYCYSKANSVKFNRHTIDSWKNPIINLKNIVKKDGRIMYPTTHDIHPDNIEEHIKVIKSLLESGNDLLIVSKPWTECIKMICGAFENYKDKIMFRFTIGSMDDSVLKFWEPNAPDFKNRYKSLSIAFDAGFETSVSCEPMLDNNIELLISSIEYLVTDSIWLGKMNNSRGRIKINEGEITAEMSAALSKLDEYQSDVNIRALYFRLKNNPKVKWKESIKKVVGIEVPTEAGLDE